MGYKVTCNKCKKVMFEIINSFDPDHYVVVFCKQCEIIIRVEYINTIDT